MSNCLLSAGIVREISFDSHYSFDAYLERLRNRCLAYKVLHSYCNVDGSVLVRIVVQYNSSPLIHL